MLHLKVCLIGIFSILNLVLAQPTLEGKFDLGYYSLAMECHGEGTPTVIIDAGMGEGPVFWGSWLDITNVVKESTRICVYDRLGLGYSRPMPVEIDKRTSQDSVDDLHKLLVTANIEKPYILVGHSWGGINIRLYTDQYPDDIVGLVLVDASHPNQLSAFLENIPPESPDDSLKVRLYKRRILSPPDLNNSEKMDRLTSLDQVQSLNDLRDLPLVIVTRSPTATPPTNRPSELNELLDSIWQDLQASLVPLSTNSLQMISEKAGHNIHDEEPELIIDAILHILSQVNQNE